VAEDGKRILDYATPGTELAVPDSVPDADRLIAAGQSPRRITWWVPKPETALAYYALSVARQCDAILGTDCCHACGRGDGTLARATVRWWTWLPIESFRFSVKSRHERSFELSHRLCDRCGQRWMVRAEAAKWGRGISAWLPYLGLLAWLLAVLRGLSGVGAVSELVLSGTFVVLLVSGKIPHRLGIWWSAPPRVRRLVHRSVLCQGLCRDGSG
jgi:hypothetical protein